MRLIQVSDTIFDLEKLVKAKRQKEALFIWLSGGGQDERYYTLLKFKGSVATQVWELLREEVSDVFGPEEES